MHSFISSEITDTIHAIQNDPVHFAKGTTYFFKGEKTLEILVSLLAYVLKNLFKYN